VKKALGIIIAVIFAPAVCVFSQETFTLTTYYPAPFGIYQRLVTNALGVGDNNSSGSIDAGDAPDPANPNQQGQVWIAEKLGIGTAFPFQEIHLRSTDNLAGYATIVLEGVNPSNDASTGLWMLYTSGTAAPAYGINVGDFRVSECTDDGCTPANRLNSFTIEKGADSNTFYIDNNSRVGIGTNNPQAKLDVDGAVRITDDSDNCTGQKSGTMRYHGGRIQYCHNNVWRNLGAQRGACHWIKARARCNPVNNPCRFPGQQSEEPNNLCCQCPAGEILAGVTFADESCPNYKQNTIEEGEFGCWCCELL